MLLNRTVCIFHFNNKSTTGSRILAQQFVSLGTKEIRNQLHPLLWQAVCYIHNTSPSTRSQFSTKQGSKFSYKYNTHLGIGFIKTIIYFIFSTRSCSFQKNENGPNIHDLLSSDSQLLNSVYFFFRMDCFSVQTTFRFCKILKKKTN